MSKNPVIHFEMPGEDTTRMSEFYTKAFGWETKQLGPEMGNYIVVTTSETESGALGGRPKAPGTINGGFFKGTEENKYPSVVISVDDIREAMKNVEAAGGKIIGGGFKAGEPDDIPDVGLFIAFMDTEGNRVSLLQPSEM